jgi:hypothetical protein
MNIRYRNQLRSLLFPAEHAVFKKISTPELVQDYLEALPQNFHFSRGETFRSPRRLLQKKSAYCFEGAVFAAASLAYHGREAYLMDIQTSDDDFDHVVALFKEKNLWGALSKTNNPVLRYRDAVYKNVRELAMSYFHEYFLENGKKTMLSYSRPFDLSKFKPEEWVTAAEPLDWLAEKLDDSPHFPVAPLSILKKARRATPIERKLLQMENWKEK